MRGQPAGAPGGGGGDCSTRGLCDLLSLQLLLLTVTLSGEKRLKGGQGGVLGNLRQLPRHLENWFNQFLHSSQGAQVKPPSLWERGAGVWPPSAMSWRYPQDSY